MYQAIYNIVCDDIHVLCTDLKDFIRLGWQKRVKHFGLIIPEEIPSYDYLM